MLHSVKLCYAVLSEREGMISLTKKPNSHSHSLGIMSTINMQINHMQINLNYTAVLKLQHASEVLLKDKSLNSLAQLLTHRSGQNLQAEIALLNQFPVVLILTRDHTLITNDQSLSVMLCLLIVGRVMAHTHKFALEFFFFLF